MPQNMRIGHSVRLRAQAATNIWRRPLFASFLSKSNAGLHSTLTTTHSKVSFTLPTDLVPNTVLHPGVPTIHYHEWRPILIASHTFKGMKCFPQFSESNNKTIVFTENWPCCIQIFLLINVYVYFPNTNRLFVTYLSNTPHTRPIIRADIVFFFYRINLKVSILGVREFFASVGLKW